MYSAGTSPKSNLIQMAKSDENAKIRKSPRAKPKMLNILSLTRFLAFFHHRLKASKSGKKLPTNVALAVLKISPTPSLILYLVYYKIGFLSGMCVLYLLFVIMFCYHAIISVSVKKISILCIALMFFVVL